MLRPRRAFSIASVFAPAGRRHRSFPPSRSLLLVRGLCADPEDFETSRILSRDNHYWNLSLVFFSGPKGRRMSKQKGNKIASWWSLVCSLYFVPSYSISIFLSSSLSRSLRFLLSSLSLFYLRLRYPLFFLAFLTPPISSSNTFYILSLILFPRSIHLTTGSTPRHRLTTRVRRFV